VAHGDVRPQDWLRFDENISSLQRVNTVLDWMRRPAAIRPKLVTLYFDAVDTAGHKFGIDSAEVNAAVAEIDTRIGDLLDGMAAMGLTANVVIVADHGMAAVDETRTIQLDDIIDRASYIAVETGPYAAIEPVTGTDDRVYDALLKPHEHMDCYRKEKLPKRLAYGTNPRVAAIICIAAPGWMILSGPPEHPVKGGAHGWDNIVPDMLALFLANGPDIIDGKTLPTFDNIDVYSLVAALAGVRPLPNDGSTHLIADTKRTH
jgi:predicted AlkP superfamily pyrophosphatase or phosphodiesterase